MRPTGPPPHRPPGRRPWELGAAAVAVRLLLLRGRLACADERLRRDVAGRVVRLRERRRLDWRRSRPGAEHVLRAVARAGARRALSAAVDGRAGALARTRADLQGAAGEPEGPGSLVHRLPRLPAAADRRCRHVRCALRAGRRGSGRPPRAGARGRPPLQQLLRRGARRAAAAAHDLRAPPRSRRRQEDEQEPRQHHSPVRHGRGGEEEGDADVHRSQPRAGRRAGHGRGQSGLRVSRRLQSQHWRKSTI